MANTANTYTLETDTTPVHIKASKVEGNLVLELTSHPDEPGLVTDDIVEVPTHQQMTIRVFVTNDTGQTLRGEARDEAGNRLGFTPEDGNIFQDFAVSTEEDRLWTFQIIDHLAKDDTTNISPKIRIKRKGNF